MDKDRPPTPTGALDELEGNTAETAAHASARMSALLSVTHRTSNASINPSLGHSGVFGSSAAHFAGARQSVASVHGPPSPPRAGDAAADVNSSNAVGAFSSFGEHHDEAVRPGDSHAVVHTSSSASASSASSATSTDTGGAPADADASGRDALKNDAVAEESYGEDDFSAELTDAGGGDVPVHGSGGFGTFDLQPPVSTVAAVPAASALQDADDGVGHRGGGAPSGGSGGRLHGLGTAAADIGSVYSMMSRPPVRSISPLIPSAPLDDDRSYELAADDVPDTPSTKLPYALA